MTEEIRFYSNKETYAFLSNFYHEPFRLDGREWQTVEHYFQAGKTDDPAEIERVRTASSPAKAKSIGRRVSLRRDWETIKIDVMRRALKAKFKTPSLKTALQATGDARLIEDAPRDYFWGAGRTGSGKNWLGSC